MRKPHPDITITGIPREKIFEVKPDCFKKNPSGYGNILPLRSPHFQQDLQIQDTQLVMSLLFSGKIGCQITLWFKQTQSENDFRSSLQRASLVHFFVGIIKRQLQHRASRRPDDSSGNEQVFQPECFNLLPIFLRYQPVELE